MATKKMGSVKGRLARITRLDECGAPAYGACGSIATKGFITVTYSEEKEDGEEYQSKNAWGEFCVNEKDPDITKWVNVSISFCEIDPDVLDVIGGANPVTHSGDTIGWTRGTAPNTSAFALEVWTKKTGQNSCVGGVQEWGYFLVPFIRNGTLSGDLTIENAPMTVEFEGQGYAATADWGEGPYGDNPWLATGGFPAGELYGQVVTDVQPPAETSGCATLTELPDKGAVEAGDVFPADALVTAQDATQAGQLVSEGYIVAPPGTNWSAGEFFTIGTFHFHWNGTAWIHGNHP